MIGKLVSSIFKTFTPSVVTLPIRQLSILSNATSATSGISPGGCWSLTSVRTTIRYHFPRPSETKRIKRHGWVTRMSTPGGRKIIMRRILKGRHCLSH